MSTPTSPNEPASPHIPALIPTSRESSVELPATFDYTPMHVPNPNPPHYSNPIPPSPPGSPIPPFRPVSQTPPLSQLTSPAPEQKMRDRFKTLSPGQLPPAVLPERMEWGFTPIADDTRAIFRCIYCNLVTVQPFALRCGHILCPLAL